MNRKISRILALIAVFAMVFTMAGCGADKKESSATAQTTEAPAASTEKAEPAPQSTEVPASTQAPAEAPSTEAPTEPAAPEVTPSGDIVIVFTSDVHCGVDQGFGYAGVAKIKQYLESRGDAVILIDNGDDYTMFDGCKLLQDCVKLDNQVLIDYITESLGGVIGEEYEELTGQGRIVITE